MLIKETANTCDYFESKTLLLIKKATAVNAKRQDTNRKLQVPRIQDGERVWKVEQERSIYEGTSADSWS